MDKQNSQQFYRCLLSSKIKIQQISWNIIIAAEIQKQDFCNNKNQQNLKIKEEMRNNLKDSFQVAKQVYLNLITQEENFKLKYQTKAKQCTIERAE